MSTNAGGVAVIAYGNARDLVAGVEVVLADGRVINGLSKLRKDNTGYDLKNLFIGAEGTLGIITAAALKLFPNPRSTSTAFIGLADPARALRLLEIARQFVGAGVTSFELIPRIGLDFVFAHMKGTRDPLEATHRLVRAHRNRLAIDQRRRGDHGLDAAAPRSTRASSKTPASRRATSSASRSGCCAKSLSEVQGPEGGSIKHDVSVPVGAAPEFLARATEAVEAFMPGARVVSFGHLGDGNIHFNVSQPVGADKQAFLAQWEAMNEVVHGVVARFHGSISAEHGVGQLKRALLRKTKDPVALDVMRALKATLDPRGILNPGKVL